MKKQLAKNGKMTLDKLGRIMEQGFKEVNEKFELVATKKEFQTGLQSLKEEMGQHFERVDQRFKGIDSRFDEIDAHFQNMDNKINALHFEIKEIKSIYKFL